MRTPKRIRLNGAAARLGRGAPVAAPRARVHPRPPRRREERPGCAARVLRPRARPAAARAGRPPGRVRRGPRAAERRAPPRRHAGVSDTSALDPWTDQRRDARRASSSRPGASRSSSSRPPSATARASSGSWRRRSATPRNRRLAPTSTSGSHATSSAARRASARTSTRSGSSRATATSGPSGRRASSASRCSRSCSPRPSSSTDRGDVPPLLLLDDALSELDGDRRRVLSARLGAAGQTLVTATGAEALPLAPAQLLVVLAGEVAARLMERLDGTLRRALRSAGVPDAGVARRGDAGVARRRRDQRSPPPRGRSASRATGRCT